MANGIVESLKNFSYKTTKSLEFAFKVIYLYTGFRQTNLFRQAFSCKYIWVMGTFEFYSFNGIIEKYCNKSFFWKIALIH